MRGGGGAATMAGVGEQATREAMRQKLAGEQLLTDRQVGAREAAIQRTAFEQEAGSIEREFSQALNEGDADIQQAIDDSQGEFWDDTDGATRKIRSVISRVRQTSPQAAAELERQYFTPDGKLNRSSIGSTRGLSSVARILPSLGRVFAATYKGPDHLGKPTRSSKIISDASPQYKLALAGLAASGTTNLMKKIGAEVAVRALQNTKDSQIPNFGQLAAGSKEHEVSAGDTLGKIAARNKTSVSELAKLNNISDPNMIKVGQRIRLPGNEALTPEYVRAAKELNSSQYGGRPQGRHALRS